MTVGLLFSFLVFALTLLSSDSFRAALQSTGQNKVWAQTKQNKTKQNKTKQSKAKEVCVFSLCVLNKQISRLSQWLDVTSQKDRARIVRDIHATVIKRGENNVFCRISCTFCLLCFCTDKKFFCFFFLFFFFLCSFAGRKQCNIIEWKDKKVVYRRYASLFFAFCVDAEDNEVVLFCFSFFGFFLKKKKKTFLFSQLIILEAIHM